MQCPKRCLGRAQNLRRNANILCTWLVELGLHITQMRDLLCRNHVEFDIRPVSVDPSRRGRTVVEVFEELVAYAGYLRDLLEHHDIEKPSPNFLFLERE